MEMKRATGLPTIEAPTEPPSGHYQLEIWPSRNGQGTAHTGSPQARRSLEQTNSMFSAMDVLTALLERTEDISTYLRGMLRVQKEELGAMNEQQRDLILAAAGIERSLGLLTDAVASCSANLPCRSCPSVSLCKDTSPVGGSRQH